MSRQWFGFKADLPHSNGIYCVLVALRCGWDVLFSSSSVFELILRSLREKQERIFLIRLFVTDKYFKYGLI